MRDARKISTMSTVHLNVEIFISALTQLIRIKKPVLLVCDYDSYLVRRRSKEQLD
jgi:hypothetical protein